MPPVRFAPAFLLPALLAAPCVAQEPPAPVAAAALADGPADDPAEPLVPRMTRDAAGDAEVEATARFLAGQALMRGGDGEAALEEFLAARELEPESVEALRSVVSVAFALGRDELGAEVAAELSDRDPADWELARTLARLKLDGGDAAAAQAYLKRAADSPNLPAAGPETAEVLRGLAVLSVGLKRIADAAGAYAELLPLMSGEAGGLDFRTRAALLGDGRTAPLSAGRVLAAAGRTAEAADALDLALSLEAGSPGSVLGTTDEPVARVQRATVLVADGRPEEALDEVRTALSGRPGTPLDPTPTLTAAAMVLQRALGDLGRGGETVGRLAALRDRFPEDEGLAVNLAAARAAAGDLDRAESELTALVERNAESVVWVPLASVRRLRKDAAGWLDAIARAKALGLPDTDAEPLRAAADEDFRDAVLTAVPPVDPTPTDEDDGGVARAKEVTRAQLAAEAGRAGEVEAGLRSALARDRARRFEVLLTLIGALNDLDEQDRAAAVTDEALADDGLDDPDLGARRAEFLTVRAQLHRQAGETDEAVAALRQAEALAPANPFFAYQAGIARLIADDDDAAVAELERALTLAAALPDGGGDLAKQSRLLLSSLLTQRGDFERGEQLLVDQLEQTPDDPTVLNDLGYLWADRGENLERAEGMIRRAVAAEPENAAFLDSLGWVLLKRGKPEEAREPLEKAARLIEGGDGTIWSHLGDLWSALGDPKAARDAWRSALQRANTADVKDEELIEALKKKLGRE